MSNEDSFEKKVDDLFAQSEIKEDIDSIKEVNLSREEVLSLTDPAMIGLDEYEIFLDYALANVFYILRNQIRTKIPDKTTGVELAKEAISLAFATYNIEKAIAANATLRTHVGWKVKQVVKTYARELGKASANELNTSDEEMATHLEETKVQADIDGNVNIHHDVDMKEEHDTQRTAFEYSKKVEWALRQVRHELPRENNLILDVGIGEIIKVNGMPFSLAEWAEYTSQNYEYVRKLFTASKELAKKKMYRKGYMDIVVDEDKTSEDFLKDTNIEEHIQKQEDDEAIIESTDVQALMSEMESLVGSTGIDKILKEEE